MRPQLRCSFNPALCPASGSVAIAERESRERIRQRRAECAAPAPRHQQNVLLAILARVAHRYGVPIRINGVLPKQRSRL